MVVSSSAFAQKYGIKGGLNFSNFGADADGTDARISPYIGAFLMHPIANNITFQPELLISTKGAEQDGWNYDYTYKLTYLDIPLMFKYAINNSFNINAGPQVGFLISSKEEMYNTFELALNLGLGYDFESGLGIDARYNIGLTNIADYNDDTRITNNVLQLGVNYKF